MSSTMSISRLLPGGLCDVSVSCLDTFLMLTVKYGGFFIKNIAVVLLCAFVQYLLTLTVLTRLSQQLFPLWFWPSIKRKVVDFALRVHQGLFYKFHQSIY